MNDTTPPDPVPDPSPTPFGAGIPAEVVEPVRLAPGLAHGPALDVRGQVAQPATPPRPEVPPHAYFHAAAAVPPPPVAAPVPPVAPQSGSATAPGTPTGAPASFAGAAPDSGASAAAANPPPSAPPVGAAPIPPASKPRGRWWIGLAHLAYLIPFPPGVIVTAVVWIWRRGSDPLMADQGREALNMQLTFWLAMSLLGLTCVASPLVPFVYVLGAVLCILAAIAAAGGERHRYPWVFRFLT